MRAIRHRTTGEVLVEFDPRHRADVEEAALTDAGLQGMDLRFARLRNGGTRLWWVLRGADAVSEFCPGSGRVGYTLR